MKIATLKPRLQLTKPKLRNSAPVQRGTPRQRGRPWATRRAAHLALFPLCAHCRDVGLVTLATEVDHIRPLWSGPGLDTDANLQSLCTSHHKAKSAREAAMRALSYKYK